MKNLKASLALVAFNSAGSLSLKMARRLGAQAGRLNYRLNTRMARVTRRNLELCLPAQSKAAREAMVCRSLEETGKLAFEICVIWKDKHTPVQERILRCDGEHLATDALQRGKGLLILAPHLGNWEVLGQRLSSLGKVVNLYQPPKIKELDPLVRESREASGCELVATNSKGVAALLKNLKSGGISGILPDQNPNEPRSGGFAPFFGQPAFTMTLIHKLILKTGCTAVFAFAKRVEGGFELVYRAAPADLYHEDEQRSLEALNQGVEDLVREAPEQYQWEYKRFKVRPAGVEGDIYGDLP